MTVNAEPLGVVYPPNNYKTSSDRIFLIGTGENNSPVTINNQTISQSEGGHFAPSFPLSMGVNTFTIRQNQQEIQLQVTRIPNSGTLPQFTPTVNIARQPNERICFTASADANATVTVNVSNQTIRLFPSNSTLLPDNNAILNNLSQATNSLQLYQGCSQFNQIGNLGKPRYTILENGKTNTIVAEGSIEILSPSLPQIIAVKTDQAITRTGPNSDYSRLTPLPANSQALVTGKEGEWLRLDYNAWIKANDTITLPTAIPPETVIRSVTSRQNADDTEIIFPLQTPIPISINQEDKTFTLTLYHTTAQTDIIKLDPNPLINFITWQQITPDQLQYTFHLKTDQQWGYTVRYEGNTLILTLRHPPQLTQNLSGIKILLDAGHGGTESGASGPNGYLEKEINLKITLLLKTALEKKGATVYLTRDSDKTVSLDERVQIINRVKPDLSLSLHYNALPDGGDAEKTQGVAVFWYYPQAQSLASFLQQYLVDNLNRSSYGVYWNNLALTRPTIAPSVLLELGFIINPHEFDWIINSQEQNRLVSTLADGIEVWLNNQLKN